MEYIWSTVVVGTNERLIVSILSSSWFLHLLWKKGNSDASTPPYLLCFCLESQKDNAATVVYLSIYSEKKWLAAAAQQQTQTRGPNFISPLRRSLFFIFCCCKRVTFCPFEVLFFWTSRISRPRYSLPPVLRSFQTYTRICK